MKPFTILSAIAAPMPADDINTDEIFPGPVSSSAGIRTNLNERGEMWRNAFAAKRWSPDGSPNPDFVLNREPYDQAKILVTGANFGCGSSRETAVWSLRELGIRCIIAPSLPDIFRSNCYKNGLLAICLSLEVVRELQKAASVKTPMFTIDLLQSLIMLPDGSSHSFEVNEYNRSILLRGLSEIALTLNQLNKIEAHENSYYSRNPWALVGSPVANNRRNER